jgi:hypothetical protein
MRADKVHEDFNTERWTKLDWFRTKERPDSYDSLDTDNVV